MIRKHSLLFFTFLCLACSGAFGQTLLTRWLDADTPRNWNTPRGAIPKARPSSTVIDNSACRIDESPSDDPIHNLLESAGWRDIGLGRSEGNIEVWSAQAGPDGMCRATEYHYFVFVAGQFAGTLSPSAMQSRSDGSATAVKVSKKGIQATFTRYKPEDPACCPSGESTLSYKISVVRGMPVVVPTEVRHKWQSDREEEAAQAAVPTLSFASSLKIADGQIAVQAGNWLRYRIVVEPWMTSAHLQGAFQAYGGSRNDIEAVVLDEFEFPNWSNGHSVRAYYTSGKITAGRFDVALAPGVYVLAFSNMFSALSPKTVSLNISLDYTRR